MLSGKIFARKFVRGKSVLSQYYISTKSGVTPSDDFQSPKIARKFIEPFSKQYPNIIETFTRVKPLDKDFLNNFLQKICIHAKKVVILQAEWLKAEFSTEKYEKKNEK